MLAVRGAELQAAGEATSSERGEQQPAAGDAEMEAFEWIAGSEWRVLGGRGGRSSDRGYSAGGRGSGGIMATSDCEGEVGGSEAPLLAVQRTAALVGGTGEVGGLGSKSGGAGFERIKGLGLLFMSATFFSFAALMVRLSTDRGVPALHVVGWRGIVQGTLAYLACRYYEKQNPYGDLNVRPYLFLRGFYGSVSLAFFYVSIADMDLGDANALFFTSPFFATVFAYLWLGERVPLHSLGTGVLSFIGVLMISRPFGGAGGGETQSATPSFPLAEDTLVGDPTNQYRSLTGDSYFWDSLAANGALLPSQPQPPTGSPQYPSAVSSGSAALGAEHASRHHDPQGLTSVRRLFACSMALLGAVSSGLALTSVRKIGRRATALQMVFYFGYVGTLIFFPLSLFLFHSAADFQAYSSPAACLSVLMTGVFAFCAQTMLNAGLQIEKVGVGSFMRNFDVVFAFLFQVFLLHEPAKWSSVLGAGIIVCSSLIVVISKFIEKPEKSTAWPPSGITEFAVRPPSGSRSINAAIDGRSDDIP